MELKENKQNPPPPKENVLKHLRFIYLNIRSYLHQMSWCGMKWKETLAQNDVNNKAYFWLTSLKSQVAKQMAVWLLSTPAHFILFYYFKSSQKACVYWSLGRGRRERNISQLFPTCVPHRMESPTWVWALSGNHTIIPAPLSVGNNIPMSQMAWPGLWFHFLVLLSGLYTSFSPNWEDRDPHLSALLI